MYAKMALLMFIRYQKLNDMTDYGSYWKKIVKNCNAIFSKNTQNSGKKVLKYFKYRRQGNPAKTCQTC